MASVNKVILIGHLGKDPEVRYSPSGDAVCNFSVATSERWKDKASGEQKESTEWHRCTAWRKLGEICGQYLKKGSLVYLEGKLQTRKWQDKDGNDRYTTEVIIDEMKMLNKVERGDDEAPAPAPRPAAKPKAAPTQVDMDDDIPF